MEENKKVSFGRKIIEIINLLIKELLEDGKEVSSDQEIVEMLLNQGYDLEEINMAFVLIFSLEGKIEKNPLDRDIENRDAKRFLTYLEKYKLSLAAQGLLIRLVESNLISSHELERILNWVVKRPEEVEVEELWKIIQKIVDDPVRFVLMTNHEWTIDFFIDGENREYLS
mgnify:CR=1 FL=1